MSQHYPNQSGQPPYYYQYPIYGTTSSTGWQAPSRPIHSSWHDPRNSTPPGPDAPVPPYGERYPSPGMPYLPTNTYAPPPASIGSPVSPIQEPATVRYYDQDVTKWGVKYNLAQQHGQEVEHRPPLPPRPSAGYTYQAPQQTLSPAISASNVFVADQPSYEAQQAPLPPPPPPPPKWPTRNEAARPPHTNIEPNADASSHNAVPLSFVPSPPLRPLEQYSDPLSVLPSSPQPRPPPPPPRPPEYQYGSTQSQFNPHVTQANSLPPRHSNADQYRPSMGPFGNAGSYAGQSPPPIADYNLMSPWSDPFMPSATPQQSPSQDNDMFGIATQDRFELTGEPSIRTPRKGGTVFESPPQVRTELEQVSPHFDSASLVGSDHPDAVSPEPEFADINRTGTIDSIIHAWTKPIQPEQLVAQGTNWHDPGLAGALKQLSLLSKTTDPYHDLSAEAKASLNRFVAMLRKEASAETDDEKYNVFDAFIRKETRLRAVLYGRDQENHPEDRRELSTDSVQLPVSVNTSADIPVDTQSSLRTTLVKSPESLAQPLKDAEPLKANDPVPSGFDQSQKSYAVANPFEDGDDEDDAELSPWARPILKGDPAHDGHTLSKPEKRREDNYTTPPAMIRESVPERRLDGRGSFSHDAPIPVNDISDREADARKASEPEPPSQRGSLGGQFPRAYTPYRYQPASQSSSSISLFDPASAASYTALRRANVDSGRAMAPVSTRKDTNEPGLSPGLRQEHAEAFLGLLRQRSVNEHGEGSESTSNQTVSSPPDELHEKVQKLHEMVPTNLPAYSESETLSNLKQRLQAIPDDFGFIHNAVLRWSRLNLESKKQRDTARRQRAEESEKNIDLMFNHNEIGYADIAILEEEHRAEEGRMMADEEIQEVESFKVDVFNFVTQTIQGQVNALVSIYADGMTLVERQSVSGSQFLCGFESKFSTALPQAMNILLVVYSKMQVRHQKLLEALVSTPE